MARAAEAAMPVWNEVIPILAREPRVGYYVGDPAASEPTALATLALLAAGKTGPASAGRQWLVEQQAPDGSIGVRVGEPEPRWPTSLAALVWQATTCAAAVDSRDRSAAAGALQRAVRWILSMKGQKVPPMPPPAHDTTLIAWPWVEGTHSWIEPTAFHVLALKSAGYAAHPRVREAVRLLVDRQLPGGGCNYGNTFILGRRLRPHTLPTALTMLALADESSLTDRRETRTEASIRWLRGTLGEHTTTMSLCWTLIALDACDARPADADQRLAAALARTRARDDSPHKLALIALAALRWRPTLPSSPHSTEAQASAL